MGVPQYTEGIDFFISVPKKNLNIKYMLTRNPFDESVQHNENWNLLILDMDLKKVIGNLILSDEDVKRYFDKSDQNNNDIDNILEIEVDNFIQDYKNYKSKMEE